MSGDALEAASFDGADSVTTILTTHGVPRGGAASAIFLQVSASALVDYIAVSRTRWTISNRTDDPRHDRQSTTICAHENNSVPVKMEQ